MLKKWFAFWAAAIGVLGLLLYWKNAYTYSHQSLMWKVGKSFADLVVIILAAARLPALLVAWCILWLTRPIKTPVWRTTVAVVIGTILGVLASTTVGAMEIIVLLSVFAVDLVTGKQGFLGHRQRYQEKQKSPLPESLAA
jgi:hypothetical protein